MRWGLAAVAFLAAFGFISALAAEEPKIFAGHVVHVDRDKNVLTLRLNDGTQTRLDVAPGLLQPVRPGEQVKVVVMEGRTVRLIGQL